MARVTTAARDVQRTRDERRNYFSQDRAPRPDASLSEEGQVRRGQGRIGQQDRTGRQTGRSSEPSNRHASSIPADNFDLEDLFGDGSGDGPMQAGFFSGGNLPLLIGGIGLLAGGAYFLMNREA